MSFMPSRTNFIKTNTSRLRTNPQKNKNFILPSQLPLKPQFYLNKKTLSNQRLNNNNSSQDANLITRKIAQKRRRVPQITNKGKSQLLEGRKVARRKRRIQWAWKNCSVKKVLWKIEDRLSRLVTTRMK